MTQEKKEKLAHNNYPYGSEMPIGSKDRSLYENKKESFLNGLNTAINYTHSCKSNSELLHTKVFNLAFEMGVEISKDKQLEVFLNMAKNSYFPIQFPEVQAFMEEDWFELETILDSDSTIGGSTYLIPIKRIIEKI